MERGMIFVVEVSSHESFEHRILGYYLTLRVPGCNHESGGEILRILSACLLRK